VDPEVAAWQEPGSSAQRPLSLAALVEGMEEVAQNVQPWDQGTFRMTRTLQEAVRNHGRVDLMTDLKEGKMVAVKRMPNKWVREGPKEFNETYATASEKPWADIAIVKMLNRKRFPFVCEHFGVFRDSEVTYVITSLATEGDLFSWCDREPVPGPKREQMLLPIVVQLFSGVRWLHELGIAHRDLSLENVLLTTEGDDKDGNSRLRVKIIDFGMVTLERTVSKEVRGKPSYQAPEMHRGQEYDTFLTDSFALGVTLFAMSVQDYPWTSTKPNGCQMFEYVSQNGLQKFLQKRKLRKGGPGQLADALSVGFVELIKGLACFDPEQRFSLGETTGPSAQRRSAWTCRWLQGRTPEDGWNGKC
jgi:serine/threonine protein kinase